MSAQGWAFDEFRHVDFGDERLFCRFIATVQTLAAHPGRSIHHACGTWGGAKASYRLFKNKKVTTEEIMQSHQIETRRRVQGKGQIVFSVQDTTFLDFETHPKTSGLGSIGKAYSVKDKLGLILHPSLILSEHGSPLGFLDLRCWARPIKPARSKSQRSADGYRLSIFEKESSKWLYAFQQTRECLTENTRIITIADRESDIYELMAECYKYGQGFVIRSRINRKLDTGKYRADKMWEVLAKEPVAGLAKVDVSSKDSEPAREATCEVRYRQIVTPMRRNLRWCADKSRWQGLPETISFTAISVKEVNSPAESPSLDWTLLTSEPVQSLEDALEKVRWYKLRWQIELFFRILKSGCRVESCRLGDAESLIKYVTLMAIVAFRIFSLEKAARENSDESCEKILTKSEWQSLCCRVNRTPIPPKTPPTAKEAVLMIARLGGFLARKNDGDPGAMVIWRGWNQLQEIAEFWNITTPPRPP